MPEAGLNVLFSVQRGHRSSIWTRTADSWVLRFHQGTVCWDEASGADRALGSSLSSQAAPP